MDANSVIFATLNSSASLITISSKTNLLPILFRQCYLSGMSQTQFRKSLFDYVDPMTAPKDQILKRLDALERVATKLLQNANEAITTGLFG